MGRRPSSAPQRRHLRAGLYCRIPKDRLAEVLGVELQEKDLRQLAHERNYLVTAVYADNDVGASDPRAKRDNHQRMLAERGLPLGGGYGRYGYSCARGRVIALREATCEVPGCDHDGVTVIEAEAAVIREAADRYLAGEGFTTIIRCLNDAGQRTSTGGE